MSEVMLIGQGDATRIPLADKSVDLVVGSPPYQFTPRTYGIPEGRRGGDTLQSWTSWMLDVTEECLRVSKGLVVWVVCGCVRDHAYQPGPEMLLCQAYNRGWTTWRPIYWKRTGIPGSGGKHWYRSDVEVCLTFSSAPGRPQFFSEPLQNGAPPKHRPGGRTSHRGVSGDRGGGAVVKVEVANPGNLITTSGGHLGHPMAHENEAPFPVDLPEFFIRGHCPEGGVVLDPFSGSGTTIQAALGLGRKAIGFDFRRSQCELGKRRNSA